MEVELMVTKRDNRRRRRQGEYRAICLGKVGRQSFAILPKAENPDNINVKPVGAQIVQENGEDAHRVGEHDQLVGQDDHDQIINETGDNEKALLLDPHTKVAAEDVQKVHIFTILISPALVSIRISSK